MKQISDGIYQLVTPFPEFKQAEALQYRHDLELQPRVMRSLPYVLPYLVKSGGDALLVDCGWDTDAAHAALQSELRHAGSSIADVTRVLITHGHPDHGGMAGRLQQVHGSKVLIHEKDVASSHAFADRQGHDLDELRVFLERNGLTPADAKSFLAQELPFRRFVADFEPDRTLQGGEELVVGDFVFEVVWTPGHTPGHVCLYEKNRKMLMTGDHVLPTITPNVSLERRSAGNPLATYIESLAKIEALDVEVMLPAHEWDIDWFKRRIAEIRAHHDERLEHMMEAVGSTNASAVDVARRVTWTTGSYDTFPPLMRLAAIGETLAHLEFLLEQGQLTSEETNGQVRFARA